MKRPVDQETWPAVRAPRRGVTCMEGARQQQRKDIQSPEKSDRMEFYHRGKI